MSSGDRAMPKEYNRIMIDHLADPMLCSHSPGNIVNLWGDAVVY